MNALLQAVIAGIAADDAEALLGAGEFVRAHKIGLERTAVLEPYASAYAASPMNDTEFAMLREALIAYVAAGSGVNIASAIHALGEFRDKTLVPVVREILVSQTRRLMDSGAAVGNAMCVLNALGEQVISGTSYSVADLDKNLADVRRYLARFGVELPW